MAKDESKKKEKKEKKSQATNDGAAEPASAHDVEMADTTVVEVGFGRLL
jgi:hypothetical protein